jgi:hypothetical protein
MANGGPKPKMQPSPSDTKARHAIGPTQMPRSGRFSDDGERHVRVEEEQSN